MFYGFPLDAEHGVKVAGLHFCDRVDPDTVERNVTARDEDRVRAWLAKRIPLANGERRLAKVCMYTNSPDANFIIDIHGSYTGVMGLPVYETAALLEGLGWRRP